MAAGAPSRRLGSTHRAGWEGRQVGEATAIVLSGGSGSRFHGSFIPKQFAEIEGKPILAYCLDTYEALPAVNEVVLIINDRYEQLYYDICSTYGYLKVRKLIPGGQTRQESVARGLEAVDPCEIVVVQDGVRPFSSEKSIIEAIEAARLYGAADVVVPTLDTIVEERDGFIVGIPDRTNLRTGYAPRRSATTSWSGPTSTPVSPGSARPPTTPSWCWPSAARSAASRGRSRGSR